MSKRNRQETNRTRDCLNRTPSQDDSIPIIAATLDAEQYPVILQFISVCASFSVACETECRHQFSNAKTIILRFCSAFALNVFVNMVVNLCCCYHTASRADESDANVKMNASVSECCQIYVANIHRCQIFSSTYCFQYGITFSNIDWFAYTFFVYSTQRSLNTNTNKNTNYLPFFCNPLYESFLNY